MKSFVLTYCVRPSEFKLEFEILYLTSKRRQQYCTLFITFLNINRF